MKNLVVSLCQGRNQDVLLKRVSVRAKRASYAGMFWESEAGQLRPPLAKDFLRLTACKTSRCNLAIEISFVPFSQRTFNFSFLR